MRKGLLGAWALALVTPLAAGEPLPVPTGTLALSTAAVVGTDRPGMPVAQPVISATLMPVATDLRERLETDTPRLTAGAVRLNRPDRVRTFYQRRHYQPAWLNDAGQPSTLSHQLLTAIQNADADGLQPHHYHSDELRSALRSIQIAYATTPHQLANLELLLSDAFLSYADHLVTGRLDPRSLDRDWLLPPRWQDYATALERALTKRDLEGTLQELVSPHPQYTRLRQALIQYRALEAAGGWPTVATGPKLEPGSTDARVRQLRERLRVGGELGAGPDTSTRFDQELEQAVKRFQARHGLAVDGVVGPQTLAELNRPVAARIRQLELNLERWRWLPDDLGQRYIMVDVPGYRLRVIENHQEVINSRIIVGRGQRQTTVFNAEMSYLVFSPYWYLPPTIIIEDKLPQLRRDPYALQRQGIRVIADGREVDPGTIDWQRVGRGNFPYTLRQDPGPQNALGGVKFMFPNRHSIYIHDTPDQHLFRRDQRALSSGCIRTEDPYELAEYLLHDRSDWDRERIVAASQRNREQRVNLSEPIPVYLFYWTAWVEDDGTVTFREDIYEHDTALAQAFYTG